ncbi:MAG: hypothetical protein J5544_00355 [Clostridia bacterium]|nr:hypothetical protein [Clostridia bacterium]
MKRTIAIILAALLLLPIAACAGGTEPAPTAVPDQNGDVSASGEPPLATPDPARAFDPETDFDNRFASQFNRIVETEDAYYLKGDCTDFLFYYDKVTGDSGILCPRPDCLHVPPEPMSGVTDCGGFIGTERGSLTYYKGRLYWAKYYRPEMDICVFSMALDGSDRELIGKLAISPEEYQPQQFWIHRGYVYFYSEANKVVNGAPTCRLAIVRQPLEGGEKQVIFEEQSYVDGEWTLRFIGDDVYILAGYDGADGSVFEHGEPEVPEDYLVLQEHSVILRWNPDMAEPEVLLDEESPDQPAPDNFYVEPDGTVWFVRQRPEDPSTHWGDDGYRLIDHLCRRDPDGTVTELFDSVIDGEYYYMRNIYDGGMIMIRGLDTKPGTVVMCIVDLEGSVIYKGDLPTAFAEKAPIGSDGTPDFMFIGCERDGFFVSATLDYPLDRKNPQRQYFLRYDITDDGLAETVICECVTMINLE